MFQDLLHGDGRFDGLEVNELGFGHGISPRVNCEGTNAAQGMSRVQSESYRTCQNSLDGDL
jgi:hypothetical protein